MHEMYIIVFADLMFEIADMLILILRQNINKIGKKKQQIFCIDNKI